MSKRTELASRLSGKTDISKTVINDILKALSEVALEDVMQLGTFTVPGVATINVYRREPMRYKNVHNGQYEMTKPGYKVNAVASYHIKNAVKSSSKH
jgi:nucleoid DNA-binding protein